MKKILFILLFIPYLLPAQNQYVKIGATGDTLTTIAEVNALSLSPDDTIFVNKGDTWRETLTVPSSGSSGSYIVFTSFGDGVNPRIIGSVEAITWTATGTANVWVSATNITNNPGVAYFGGNLYFEGTDDTTRNGVQETYDGSHTNLTAEYDWSYNANTVYCYAATDPDTRYNAVEATQRQNSVHLNSQEYIEINGIDLSYGGQSGVHSEYPTAGLTGFTIRNCELSFIGYPGGGVGFGTHVTYNQMLFELNDVHDCGRRGMSVNHYGDPNIAGIIIQDNHFYNGDHTTSLDLAVGVVPGSTGSIDDVIFRRNLVEQYPDNTTNAALDIYTENNDNTRVSITGLEISNNIFTNCWGGVQIVDVQEASILNNTFYGLNQAITINGWQLLISRGSTNITVLNNTFYGNTIEGYSSEDLVPVYITGVDFNDIALDYNLYYSVEATQNIIQTPAGRYTMAQWEAFKTANAAYSWEVNSPDPADPIFVDDPDDLHPDTGSPMIGAAVGVGLNTDKDGDEINEPPDIGAYAYDSSPPVTDPATVTTTAISTIKSINALSGGNVTDIGGASVTGKGVCWSTSSNPTVSDSFTTDGSGTGAYTSTITGLLSNTTYHVRSWAENGVTSYGQDIEFTTTKFTEVGSVGVRVFSGGKLVIVKN